MKTTSDFLKMKANGEKIVMLTAYDYPSATFAEQAGVDMILVGDSLGMVVLGYSSTMPVTVADMVHHAKAVRRGAKNTFVVVDMPFGSYHGDVNDTLKTAVSMMQETGADALKVEGAGDVVPVISKLTSAGIPVVAHLGLQPQLAGVLGGYKVQGKTAEQAAQLIENAKQCEAAGACAVVLECIPHQLTDLVSAALTIPTIGIGAGIEADGQVLVFHDMLSYGSHHVPKFVAQFADMGSEASSGIASFVNAVKTGTFPTLNHSFTMKEEALDQLYGGVK
ncbi:3-methyl-2-oxobutanoate hydroxymethyltransferase [Lysinibacillus sphaericus]|uniref:3-methyl-2-oxobutanoate hydroxymethyltransferase n=1 Tax=Lysinibacillus sphaericus TaxID=1421 RepID=A0A2S0K2I8_LYSSH|nr:3-methyl-2-oxobutanoate hydroxymethyltransferase [Lysinibacillus sphaericus]AVK97561.1 3-methyl-2-oxobutanoate hydroxymethyltransferase [Lysinibacillus sphaericus]MED4545573.1 3-methyl-2-oxobutanoate hydroxymethyltransferase [Lysinibacillus sphaericus]TKI17763.1 3-methyl-2-oxobutanoate hydroxymethyltransferase [Lysinibacillus sphaericus]UDK96287.1 3-methyl-2-oxobutanoate hydroxymethyltransferase [Lysinibacillus sphaericus]SUV16526.1 3-methyl-2-oxobutanoate hydroxymethyltransferase [Lysiniba